MKLHFVSGLPRSGSTLLGALLRQNPRFHHHGMSSPVAQLVMRVQHATSRGSESGVLVDDERRKRLLRGIFTSYYGDVDGVVFDTNRAWTAKMALIAELFPESKVICMVRDVAWIMNSIEKLIQANPTELSGIFDYRANSTVYSRVDGLAGPEGMVGFSINALREAYYGPFADRLLLIDYEALVRRPGEALGFIYEFIGEEPFAHDFKNFEYEAKDFDQSLGTPGLHKVKGPVKWIEQQTILPPAVFDRFSLDAFWRNQATNLKMVRTVNYEGLRQEQGLRVVR